MEPSPSCLIVSHGGEWNENIYEGGRKEYIPIPPTGITFQELLRKVEVRLKLDKSMYLFELDALVKSPAGETMRMKITNEFEWSTLISFLELPTVYVTVCSRINKCPRRINRASARTSQIVNVQNMSQNDDDDDVPEFGSDCNDRCDSISDDAFDINDDNVGGYDEPHDFHGSDLHTLPPLDVSNQSNEEINEEFYKESRWLIPGTAHQASLPCEDLVIPCEPVTNELVMGAIFLDKMSMQAAVGLYHMKNHMDFLTVRSSTTRYHLVCKLSAERCEFIIRAGSVGNAWRINEWSPHTCEMDLRYHCRPKVSSKVLASQYVDNLTEDGYLLRPRDIQRKARRDFGVTVKYRTALAGKKHALNQSYGDPDKSFQLLPKYLYMLEHLNPGSIVELQTCDDDSFQFCFFALAACIRAFRACRPVIVVDGTHLKGKYKGIMFIAATKDANEQITPLAFGIGDVENDSSWIWFFQQLRRTFGCPENFLIVSDQHLSIKNAVDLVYPGTPHALCTFHIQSNMKKWGFGAAVTDIFTAAAGAYRSQDFEMHMQNLELTAPRAHAKIMNIHPSRWTICKCPVRRYAFGTSNAVESLNNRIRWGRTLPVCALLEYCRDICQDWFYKRRTIADSRTQELSPYATSRLENAIEAGRFMKVDPITDLKFKVISGAKSHIVDISSRECTCHVFDLDLIPCSHATAAISYARQSPASFVHAYYSTKTWCEIYAAEVMPIPEQDDWIAPPDVALRVVRTPPNPRQAGRPRSKRIPSGYHKTNSRVCSRCHQKGHYQSTCTAVIQITLEEEVSSNQPSSSRPRKPKKCGICGVVGHTRLTCDNPHRFA